MHILIQEKFAYNCLAEAVWETQARGLLILIFVILTDLDV